ncbi:MAG: peptidase M75 superfamily protein [Flavobacteriales bacterium]|nr:peptidase M75 superfamily protein [Flavobacteriales bacterium]
MPYLYKNSTNMKITFRSILLISVLYFSCGDSADIPSTNDGFDRSILLSNISNNIIIPSYNNFDIKINELKLAKDQFISNPNQSNINEMRNKWLNSYRSFQYVEMFNIGKSEEINFHKRMNTYPTNTTIINNNIDNLMYDFTADNYSNYSSQGFPALDYLLYGLDVDSNNVINYYLGSESSKYLNYLNAIITEMVVNTELVKNYWANNNLSFITSSGNTSTSSLNKITNDFIYYYEKGLRANKIGIPAGVYSNSTIPNNVEGLYRSDISKNLSLHALDACDRFYHGKSLLDDSLRTSLYSYLEYIDLDNGLKDDISLSFQNSKNKIEILNNNFSEQITTDNIKMLEAFDALQSTVVLLKTDMLSNLNINVDYVDADGD